MKVPRRSCHKSLVLFLTTRYVKPTDHEEMRQARAACHQCFEVLFESHSLHYGMSGRDLLRDRGVAGCGSVRDMMKQPAEGGSRGFSVPARTTKIPRLPFLAQIAEYSYAV